MVSGLNWYVVCKVSGTDSLQLEIGEKVDGITMPFASTGSIPAKVVAINQESRQSDAVVVLECSYMNNELSKVRKESVQIAVNTHSGIMVNKKAIHVEPVMKVIDDGSGRQVKQEVMVQGVYVLYGSELVFKEIVPLSTYSTFVLCDPNPEEDATFNGETIKLYDEVVVGGTDLYDGKLFDGNMMEKNRGKKRNLKEITGRSGKTSRRRRRRPAESRRISLFWRLLKPSRRRLSIMGSAWESTIWEKIRSRSF